MIQSAFDTLLGKIGVSQAQRSQGSKSHQYVRGLLDRKHELDASFPWLADGDFLSGSYARETKIHPLDDIDVMIIIDGTGLTPHDNGQVLNAEVRGHGNFGSPVGNYTGPDGMISSRRILEVFRDALQEAYPNSTIQKKGQSVNVYLESYDLGLDIVPSFHIVPRDGGQDLYFIPQGGESHAWMKTNPKKDAAICDTLEAKHDGKFKAVVRLLKHWNRVHNADRLTSYHLETIAYYVFHYHPGILSDYGTALQYFFEHAPAYLQNSCDDATGIGGPVDLYLLAENRRLSIVRLNEALVAVRPLGLIMPTVGALAGWRKVFGASFGL